MLEHASEGQRPVTELLRLWSDGDSAAQEELIPVVYGHLRKLAASALAIEKPGHTLSATALVHEAYLRLVGSEVSWSDRNHFYSLAARLMRRVLVDHARAAHREKRGGGALKVTLGHAANVSGGQDDLLAIDAALEALERIDPRKAKLLEMLYFGGITQAEAARALDISESTVLREIKLAKAWLRRELDLTGGG